MYAQCTRIMIGRYSVKQLVPVEKVVQQDNIESDSL